MFHINLYTICFITVRCFVTKHIVKQTATLEWIKKINALKPGDRMNRTWEYVLVGESVFYSLSSCGATIADICRQCRVSYSMATGSLFD